MIPEEVSNASVAIIVAIVALMGTIVGAFIVAGTNYVIAVRRERADRERDRRKNAIQLKRAARLVYAELAFGASVMTWALREREWSDAGKKISSEAWEKYSETIAAEVSDEVWMQLLQGREALDVMNTDMNRDLEAKSRRMQFPALIEGYTRLLDEIKRGRDALDTLAFPDSTPAEEKEPVKAWSRKWLPKKTPNDSAV